MPLPAILIQMIAALVVIFLAFYSLKSGSLTLQMGLLAAPVVFFLINNPAVWLVVILGLVQSKLILPGLPQGLQLVHVMMAGFAMMILARNCITKSISFSRRASDVFLYGFLFVLAATAAHRGIGIRALGSDQWGGMSYIKLFVAAAFLMTTKYVVLTPKQIRAAIFLMIGLSMLPLAAQLLYQLSGGRIYMQYRFVEAYTSGLLASVEASESGSGVVRLHAVGGLAFSLLMAGVVMIRPVGPRKMLLVFVVGFSILLAGLSGFRGQILTISGTLLLFAVFAKPTKQILRLGLTGGILLLSLALCYPVIQYLPAPIQRSLSFLPGADIPIDIMMDATYSYEWRTRIWKLAWNEVPDYLWIGKGFTFNQEDMFSLSARRDGVLNAFLVHNYHSGPLSLLLDLGLFGLIFGGGFLLVSTIEIFRRLDRITGDPILRRFYLFMGCFYIYNLPSYFLVFGDVRETFPALFIYLAILKMVERTNASILQATAEVNRTNTNAGETLDHPDVRNRRLVHNYFNSRA